MDRTKVVEYLRGLSPKAFAEVFYESTRDTHPWPGEEDVNDVRYVLVYAHREVGDSSGDWSLSMVCPTPEDWSDDAPVCQHGDHCKIDTISWAKSSECPICHGEVYGT